MARPTQPIGGPRDYARFLPAALLVPGYFYALEQDMEPVPRIGIKMAPILALMYAVIVTGRLEARRVKNMSFTPYALWLAAGLAVCSVGDALMEMYSLGHRQFFLYGLATFLVGHLLYIVGFLTSTAAVAPLAALPWAAFGGAAFSQLAPVLESGLFLPVAVYTAVISAMGWRALARRGRSRSTSASQVFAAAGALIFMISDLTIAVNAFHTPIQNAKHYVMATYYTGQVLIAASAVGARLPRAKRATD